tara:strand:+ start:2778 stop:3101 length:324 start_codon:yes stop_codon:yes gene_type:complete
MAITYNWQIFTCEHDIATGGICAINWRCTASETVDETTYKAIEDGSISLTPDPSASDFVAYADVTEAMAQGWVWDQIGQSDTESALAADIDAQRNPVTASGNPWDEG